MFNSTKSSKLQYCLSDEMFLLTRDHHKLVTLALKSLTNMALLFHSMIPASGALKVSEFPGLDFMGF